MQANKKGGSESQGSTDDLDNAPELVPPAQGSEEMTLVTSAEEDTTKSTSSSGGSGKHGSDKTGGSSGGGGNPPGKKDSASGSSQNLPQFLREVVLEFKKITWPDGKEVAQATWSVLALVAIITLLVLGFDWLLAHAFFQPLEHFARLHGGGVGH
ncbi:MAG TPA: preprotein translocase subunit SecE [Oculatellaceae cyanobacterium]